MQSHIGELINAYYDFHCKVSEYEVVNNKIKEYVKENNNKVIVDYYSLKLRLVDKSFYSEEIIPYLIENKFKNFIIKDVDDKKLSALIDSGIVNRDFALSNIEKEKTVLDIKFKNMPEVLEKYKEEVKNAIDKDSWLDVIKKREKLKPVIDASRYRYYKEAKNVKDLLNENRMSQYRFQYSDDIGFVKIRIKEREYCDSFVDYIEANRLDALKLSVNNQKLLKSKNKKLDRDYVNKYKTENFQEYLYVTILRSALAKK